MRQQANGLKLAVPNGAAAPTNADGLALADFLAGAAARRCRKYGLLVQVAAAGAFTVDLAHWGRDTDPPAGASKQWWLLGTNQGKLNDGVAISGNTSYRNIFMVEDLGWLDRYYVQATNPTGGPTVTTWLQEILEGNIQGSD